MRVGAVLIVRDEEAHLAACLEPLRDTVDEIVVVDTGSQDRTLAIARAIAHRVGAIAWTENFAAARNAALKFSTADFVLSIDADEIILNPEAARERLLAFATRHQRHTAGLIAIESPMGPEPQALIERLQTPRFFRRDAFRFEGAIHEQLKSIAGPMSTAETGVRVHHSGYALSQHDSERKSARNLALLDAAIAREPDSCYLHYQRGRANYCAKQFEAAIRSFDQALGLWEQSMHSGSEPPSPRVVTDCVTTMAYALINSNQTWKAGQILQRYAEAPATGLYADYPYVKGYVRLMMGDVEGCRQAMVEALERGPDWSIVRGTGGHLAYYHLGLCAEAQGSYAEAAVHYAAALRDESGCIAIIDRLLDWPLELDRPIPESCSRAANGAVFSARYEARLTALREAGRDQDAANFATQVAASC